MRMRTKLTTGFLGVLILLIVVGGVGWYGMDRMGARADRNMSVGNGISALLLAKVSQLRFMAYGDRNEVELTSGFLAESDGHFKQAVRQVDKREDEERIRHLATNIALYSKDFRAMVDRTDAIAQTDAAIQSLGTSLTKTFTHMLDDIESRFRSQPGVVEFDIFKAVNNGRTALNGARVALWRFRTTSTPENAGEALRSVAVCRAELATAGLLTFEDNKATLRALSEGLTRYEGLLQDSVRQRNDQTAAVAGIHKRVIETVALGRTIGSASEAGL